MHGKTLAHGFQYFHRLVHHFRANAITRQNGNMVILRHYTVSFIVLFILSFALQFFFDFGGAPDVVQHVNHRFS